MRILWLSLNMGWKTQDVNWQCSIRNIRFVIFSDKAILSHMILDQFGQEPIAEKQVEKAPNLKEIVTSPNMPTSCYIKGINPIEVRRTPGSNYVQASILRTGTLAPHLEFRWFHNHRSCNFEHGTKWNPLSLAKTEPISNLHVAKKHTVLLHFWSLIS